jgi:hypothetical protein
MSDAVLHIFDTCGGKMAKRKNSQTKPGKTTTNLGAAGGVAAGAALGSLLGPIGAAVGAVVGGIAAAKVAKKGRQRPNRNENLLSAPGPSQQPKRLQ